MSLLIDNFDDNTKGAQWGANGNALGVGTTGVTVAEQNTRLEISLPVGQSGANYSGYLSANSEDLTNDVRFIRCVQVPTGGTSGGPECELRVYSDTSNSIAIIWDGGLLYFQNIIAGVSSNPFNVVYNSSTMAWWRLRFDSTNVYFDTAPSSASNPPASGDWTNQYSKALPIAITALKTALTGGTWTSEPNATTAIFDGLNTATIGSPAFANPFGLLGVGRAA